MLLCIQTWLLKGWGFCDKTCQDKYNIYQNKLLEVSLSILSDEHCEEIGNIAEDNLGGKQVINTKRELCGGFLNKPIVTFINYTKKQNPERSFLCVTSLIYISGFRFEFSKLEKFDEVLKSNNNNNNNNYQDNLKMFRY